VRRNVVAKKGTKSCSFLIALYCLVHLPKATAHTSNRRFETDRLIAASRKAIKYIKTQ